MFGLHNIQSKFSQKVSIFFFKKRLPISYAIFNFFFSKFIINRKNNNFFLKSFDEKGYSKLDITFKEIADEVKNNLVKIKESKNRIEYELDKSKDKDILNKIDSKLKNLSKDLNNYYCSEVHIADLSIWEHFSINNAENNTEYFSERFHCDGYISNYLKIHINLIDVDINCGPLNIVNKKKNFNFLKDFVYTNRENYINSNQNFDYIYSNVGLKGDAIMFDSPNCFHRATIPSKSRLMLQLILFISPNKKIIKRSTLNFVELKKYTKPSSVIYMIFIFYLYLKNKFLKLNEFKN